MGAWRHTSPHAVSAATHNGTSPSIHHSKEAVADFRNTHRYAAARCQTIYQTYIKAVISRYRTSTAVFAWELANEPRCNGCQTSVLTNWVRITSNYIRSLDSDHMVRIDQSARLARYMLTTPKDYHR